MNHFADDREFDLLHPRESEVVNENPPPVIQLKDDSEAFCMATAPVLVEFEKSKQLEEFDHRIEDTVTRSIESVSGEWSDEILQPLSLPDVDAKMDASSGSDEIEDSADSSYSKYIIEVISAVDDSQTSQNRIPTEIDQSDSLTESYDSQPIRRKELPNPDFLMASIRDDLMTKLVQIDKKFKANTRRSDTQRIGVIRYIRTKVFQHLKSHYYE